MSDLTVRRADVRDLDFLVAGNLAMAKETEDLSLDADTLRLGISHMLNSTADGLYLIAEQQGRAAGNLMITYEWSDWRNGRFWWIQSVYVHPDFRRKGVYRALHEAVREMVEHDDEACGIRLYVEKENDNAQQTYTAIGMEETYYRVFEELRR